jgi:2-(1,2-epoxy-1,2-dihydrophenyl)acetyl-CoA isomerase
VGIGDDYLRTFQSIVTRININKPIVAAVNGVAAGAGANSCVAMWTLASSSSFIRAF